MAHWTLDEIKARLDTNPAGKHIIHTKDNPQELLWVMAEAKKVPGHKDPMFYPLLVQWLSEKGFVLHASDHTETVSSQGLNRAVTNAIASFVNHATLAEMNAAQIEDMMKKAQEATISTKNLPSFLETEHTEENLRAAFTSIFE